MKIFDRFSSVDLNILGLFLLTLVFTISCDNQEQSIAKEPLTQPVQLSEKVCERTEGMPEKLRMDNYRGPPPDCVPKGITINTDDLEKLIQQNPNLILIDVLSVITRPNAEFSGQWLPNKERMSLPESVWLPNVGYGYLDDEMHHYFKTQLESLTQADKNKPLVFFCIADCWMSWNAVQRAHEYGYTKIYWYKNGTDGWAEAGLPLEKIDPIPLNQKE